MLAVPTFRQIDRALEPDQGVIILIYSGAEEPECAVLARRTPADEWVENAPVAINEAGLPAPLGDFDILVDGEKVGHYEPNRNAAGFYPAQYAVPANLISGKSKVTVRFQAAAGSRIVPVCGVRIVRANGL